MTSPKFVFYVTCLIWGNIAQKIALNLPSTGHHDGDFLSAKTGEHVTLTCFDGDEVPRKIYWYKQSLGQKLQLIATFYRFDKKNHTFYGEFENNPRFTLETQDGGNHLKISDLHISDSASYSCLSTYISTIKIIESKSVRVEASDSNILTLVHQSASDGIQPGGSVTLNCTVHTGTYYCANASCGHVSSGDRTKPDCEGKVDITLVYVLSGALALTTLLVVLLAVSVCKMKKRISCLSGESPARSSAPSTTNTEGYEDAHNLHYAALPVKQSSRSRRQRNNTDSECVYSSVKL